MRPFSQGVRKGAPGAEIVSYALQQRLPLSGRVLLRQKRQTCRER